MTIRVESTRHSTVVVCSCGARFVAASRRAAVVEAAAHERLSHPAGDRQAVAAAHHAGRSRV